MSNGAAQGAGNGAAAAEPTVEDDGFTAEERAQFAEMEGATSDEPGAGAGGDGGEANAGDGAAGGAGAGAGAEGAAGAAGGKTIASDDDDDDEPGQAAAGGQQGQDQNGQARQPRRVNYNKYQKMEERALQAEKRATEVQEMFSRTDERLKLLNEALSGAGKTEQAKNENADPEPDKTTDVFGWMDWAGRQMQNMHKLVTETSQRSTQQAQVSEAERVVADTYIGDVRRFVADKENPNAAHFAPAYQFLMDQRTGELALYHFGLDIVSDDGKVDYSKLKPEQERKIKADISAEERELVQNAIAGKQSPASAVFKMARARGFRPAPPQQAAQAAAGAAKAGEGGKAPGSLAEGAGGQQGGQQQGNGQRQPSVADEIRRVREGQAANISLSQGAGSPGTQELTPQMVANMPQAEFDALMERIGEAGFARLMGGEVAA